MIRKITLFILLTFAAWANATNYIITDFGVSTDSTKLQTQTIQQIIDKASANGGGTIVVPKGVYLTGALFFKPNTSLQLSQDAVLKGSDNIADYPLQASRMEGRNLDYYAALINAYHVNNFSISGPGTINGNGARYWKQFWDTRDSLRKQGRECTNLEVHRPRLLFLWACNTVNIKNVKLKNSGFWTTHLYQCNDVLIEGCDIRSPFKPVKAPSTDGIDIDVCKRVTVRNCYISVNDDGVCIKGGKGVYARKQPGNGVVEDILVENCTFGESHGLLTIGSESIIARNITVRNCKVHSSTPILRIKMRPDTYQNFENIKVDGITGTCGTVIELRPWKQFFDLEGSNLKPSGVVKNIEITNVNVKCKSFGEIQGNPADKVSNISFNNCTITATNPELKNKYKKVFFKNVVVNGKEITNSAK